MKENRESVEREIEEEKMRERERERESKSEIEKKGEGFVSSSTFGTNVSLSLCYRWMVLI